MAKRRWDRGERAVGRPTVDDADASRPPSIPQRRPDPAQLNAARRNAASNSPEVTALRQLCQYVWSNRGRLGYFKRLDAGLPIGSGQIEGACKTIVGRRLKLNSARWRPERAEHITALCCLEYSQRRQTFWLN